MPAGLCCLSLPSHCNDIHSLLDFIFASHLVVKVTNRVSFLVGNFQVASATSS